MRRQEQHEAQCNETANVGVTGPEAQELDGHNGSDDDGSEEKEEHKSSQSKPSQDSFDLLDSNSGVGKRATPTSGIQVESEHESESQVQTMKEEQRTKSYEKGHESFSSEGEGCCIMFVEGELSRDFNNEKEHNSFSGEEECCILCLESERFHAFLPCGHRVICSACAWNPLVLRRECPYCRSPSSCVIKVHI